MTFPGRGYGGGGGHSYLPGVEELLPPVFKDVLLTLQEAHTCTTEGAFTRSSCAFTHHSLVTERFKRLNHVTWE